ncbi:malate:quinone oxidoreductase [Staphylococcus xylosus]
MLKELAPDWNIKLFERLDKPAIESSNERHNARYWTCRIM